MKSEYTPGPKWKIQLVGNTGKAWLVLTTDPADSGTVIAGFPPTTSHVERELCAAAPSMQEALRDLLNLQVEARVMLCKLQDFMAPSRSKSVDSAIERIDEGETQARAALKLAGGGE